MIHLTGINWAQLILIDLGTLFQIVAICAIVRETSVYRRFRHSKKEEVDADQELPCCEETAVVQADPRPKEYVEEKAPKGIKAGDLTRTAQTKFVQSFKFLDDSKRQYHLSR